MKKLLNFINTHSLLFVSILGAFAIAMCYAFGDLSLSDLVGASGANMAMALGGAVNFGKAEGGAVDGQDGVGKHIAGEYLNTENSKANSPDLLQNVIDRDIVKMYQSGIPFDQMLRHMNAVPTKSMEYDYYSVDTRPIKSTITAQVTGLKNGTPTDISVADPYQFNVGDVIRVGKIQGYKIDGTTASNGVYLQLYVTKRTSNKLTVQSFNASQAGVTIANGTVIYRVSTALHEGDVQTAAYSALPTKKSQNMQIFKSQTMETSIHIESNKEVEWTPSDQDEYMLYDFRRSIEAAFLFGVRGKMTDLEANREVLTCSGAVEQIIDGDAGNVITYANEIDDNYFVDLTKKIFVGNNGSGERLVFMGSELMATISKIDSIKRQIDAQSTERIFGYTWNKIKTNFGTLNVYMHPLFDEYDFAKCAIVIDPQYVSKRVFRSIATDQLKLKEAGVFDGRANVVTEISSVVLKYPKCHKLIVPDTWNSTHTYGEA